MKIIFFGSPAYTIQIINQIKHLKNELLGVVTQNEKIGKRGKSQQTPVEIFAKKNQIRVFSPEKITDAKFVSSIRELNPDLCIIFAYGKILPSELIKTVYGIAPILLPSSVAIFMTSSPPTNNG